MNWTESNNKEEQTFGRSNLIAPSGINYQLAYADLVSSHSAGIFICKEKNGYVIAKRKRVLAAEKSASLFTQPKEGSLIDGTERFFLHLDPSTKTFFYFMGSKTSNIYKKMTDMFLYEVGCYKDIDRCLIFWSTFCLHHTLKRKPDHICNFDFFS